MVMRLTPDTDLQNADWIKPRSWDLPRTLDGLLAYLRDTNTPIEHFLTLPAAVAMPEDLRGQLVHVRSVSGLASDLARLADELGGVETKGIRRVRDVSYWGMPFGTPIVAGMRPQGSRSLFDSAVQHVAPKRLRNLKPKTTSMAPRKFRKFTPHEDFDRLEELGVDIIDSYTGDEMSDDTLAVIRDVMDDVDNLIPGIGKHLTFSVMPLFAGKNSSVGGVTRNKVLTAGESYAMPDTHPDAHDWVDRATTGKMPPDRGTNAYFKLAYAMSQIDQEVSDIKAESHPGTEFTWIGLNTLHHDKHPREKDSTVDWALGLEGDFHSLDATFEYGYPYWEDEYPTMQRMVKTGIIVHEIGHALDFLAQGEPEWDVVKTNLRLTPRRPKISTYGKKSMNEYVAESWTDYFLNKEPKPNSQIIGESLVAALTAKLETLAEEEAAAAEAEAEE